MAAKPSDLLSGLPSVSELLEKPPVRALAARWNRSVVAAGVRSFLDQLRSDLQRRSAEAGVPSVRELAERAARHVVAMEQQSERPAINATGQIYGKPWQSPPLAEAALERMIALGRDFVRSPRVAASDGSPAAGDYGAVICRLTGATGATAVHSYAGGVWLALAAIAGGQELVVSRADLGDVEPGSTLVQLASAAGARIKEVGTTNRTTAGEYEAAISPQTGAIVLHHSDYYRVAGATERPELEELIGLARERELLVVDLVGGAPLAELPPEAKFGPGTIESSIAAGADLVVARGDGLVGGPPCGLIVGRQEVVRRLTEHALFAAWRLDAVTAGALTATLECYDGSAEGRLALPALQFLSASLKNLRNRAERLAPQIAGGAGIAAAEVVASQSPIGLPAVAGRSFDSYGVALAAVDGDVRGLKSRLDSGPLPVCGRLEGDRLILDLRTVFPRQDALIAQIVGGGARHEAAVEPPAAEAPVPAG